MRVRQKALLLQARRILETAAPLDGDCGSLCGGHCCRTAGSMWLFPGEAALYETADGLRAVPGRGNLGYPHLLCAHDGGGCRREDRPLACRVFPLFPMALPSPRTGRLRIFVAADPRALPHCPLLRAGAPPMTPAFRRAVARAGRRLLREPELRRYLVRTGDYLRELARLAGV